MPKKGRPANTAGDGHTIRAWTFQGALLESYRYAPGRAEALSSHSHDEYQLGVSLNFPGEYTYRGARYPVPAGSLSVIHPGEMHSARDLEDRHLYAEFRKIYLPPDRLQSVTSETTGSNSALPFFGEPIILDADLFLLFLEFHAASENARSLLERESLLMMLLAQLVGRYADTRGDRFRTQGRERKAVRRARDYLRDNYAENVSLERLAAIAGLSPFHFLRMFSREVGMPPHRYQVQSRVERAKLLLAEGVPAREAALIAGFVDQSHLTRHFRRLVRVTPGRYALRRGEQ